MQDFQFYVTDDRYGVRTVMFVLTRDVDAARDLAERIHRETPHYEMIEAFAGDVLLFTVGAERNRAARSDASGRWSAPASTIEEPPKPRSGAGTPAIPS